MKGSHMPSKTKLTMGVELEAYAISIPDNRICRELHFPRPSTVEKGEKFTRDWSIGTEYNSKVFRNPREAFFLLKNGLRKYTAFSQNGDAGQNYVVFPVGGWIDRFAGTHIHLGIGKKGIEYDMASKLAAYLHDHIPFIIALSANSCVWREKINTVASNRLLLGADKYCKITRRDFLYKQRFRELTWNKGSQRKPPTLELRVMDGSVPEYIVAAMCVLNAVALRWVRRKKALNISTHPNYLAARESAIRHGAKADLVWSNHWITVPQYVDLFFRKYKDELREIDMPEDILSVFKYLKKGWTQADVIRGAAAQCRRRHVQTWQKRFAKRYAAAVKDLLDGNSYKKFSSQLGVRLPDIKNTWLGTREAGW